MCTIYSVRLGAIRFVKWLDVVMNTLDTILNCQNTQLNTNYFGKINENRG